jgi:salicylate hydroxylase
MNSVMHRADYQHVLANEARRLGAKFRLGADVVSADCDGGRASVTLASGERLTADVVVGADGLHGSVREFVLGYLKEPEGSGDLAYRITIPREKLENDPDPFIRGIVNESVSAIWCQFYLSGICPCDFVTSADSLDDRYRGTKQACSALRSSGGPDG